MTMVKDKMTKADQISKLIGVLQEKKKNINTSVTYI